MNIFSLQHQLLFYKKMELWVKLKKTKTQLAILLYKEKLHKLIFGDHVRFVLATWDWKEIKYPNDQVIKYRKVSWFWTYQRFDFSEKEITTGYQLDGEDGIYLANVEPEQFQNHLLYLEDIYSKADNLCIRLGILTSQMEKRK
ncbi:hypothetical protein PQC65_gp196 [Aeromonas phage pAEv1810]|uniref:hypothetical protein n=1 Tax=Aeromonas phage pAEv1810 TaxID=2908744 RepID=UPI0023291400|nr:hypothetical protein PQC65_gp196 [Aeromonas phage pAEv1810]UIS25134.1 hypothetical protein pAEv1810_196 [Aeromonas phage pAEv1810]